MRATLAAALCGLVVAGCGAGEEIRGGGTIPGASMTIAALLPLDGPDAAAARDMIGGQKLALDEAGGMVGDTRVAFAVYDTAGGAPEREARAAIEDIQVAAAIGGLSSRTTARLLPIIDAAGVLMVSPGTPDPAVAASPELSVSGERRLFVLAPDAPAQAAAMVATALPGPVALEEEAGRDPEVLGAALREAAAGRAGGPGRARTLLYAGQDTETAAAAARDFARAHPRGRIVFPDALARRGLGEALRGRAARISHFVAAVPAEPPAAFREAFRARLGREPGPYAYLGYTAMERVLAAIRAAAPRANHRERIIDAYARESAEPLEPSVWAPAGG